MRRVFLVIAACALCAFGQEQKTLSLFASAGYGFGIGGEFVGSSDVINGSSLTETKDHYLNYGKGIKIDGGAIIALMENLGLQAGISYSMLTPSVKDEDKTSGATVLEAKTSFRASQLGIKALLQPRFRILDLLDIYVGFGTGLFFTSSSVEAKSSVEATKILEQKNSPSLGFLGSIGCDFPVSDAIAIFAEVGTEAFSVQMKEAQMTDENGNKLGEPTIFEKDAVDRPAPVPIPSTNWAIRIGTRFAIF